VTDIFEEAKRESSDAKKIDIFRKILPKIIIITIIIILVMTIQNWYRNKEEKQNQKASQTLLELLQKKDITIEDLKNQYFPPSSPQQELFSIFVVNQLLLKKASLDIILDHISNLIAENHLSEITKSYLKLIWLNNILTKKQISVEEEAKIQNYLDSFEEKDLFYNNAILIRSLLYYQKGEKELATKYAEKILMLKNIPSILKEQAYAIIRLTNYQ
jgi:hypothetical protein